MYLGCLGTAWSRFINFTYQDNAIFSDPIHFFFIWGWVGKMHQYLNICSVKLLEWDSPKFKLCYHGLWLALSQCTLLLEEKTVTIECCIHIIQIKSRNLKKFNVSNSFLNLFYCNCYLRNNSLKTTSIFESYFMCKSETDLCTFW